MIDQPAKSQALARKTVIQIIPPLTNTYHRRGLAKPPCALFLVGGNPHRSPDWIPAYRRLA